MRTRLFGLLVLVLCAGVVWWIDHSYQHEDYDPDGTLLLILCYGGLVGLFTALEPRAFTLQWERTPLWIKAMHGVVFVAALLLFLFFVLWRYAG